jgi:hypothetical protein
MVLVGTGAFALVLATGWFMFMIQETPHYWTHMFPGLAIIVLWPRQESVS